MPFVISFNKITSSLQRRLELPLEFAAIGNPPLMSYAAKASAGLKVLIKEKMVDYLVEAMEITVMGEGRGWLSEAVARNVDSIVVRWQFRSFFSDQSTRESARISGLGFHKCLT